MAEEQANLEAEKKTNREAEEIAQKRLKHFLALNVQIQLIMVMYRAVLADSDLIGQKCKIII